MGREFFSVLFALVFMAGSAQAAMLEVEMHFELDLGGGLTDPANSVDLIASFSQGPPLGPGITTLEADVVAFAFSIRAPLSQTAEITPGFRGVHAVFENGVFRNLATFNLGGIGNVELDPSVSFNKELVTLGLLGSDRTSLTDQIEFCGSCTAGYVQVGEENLTTVIPLPATGPLLAVALFSVFGRRWVRA